jgi:hypothetical protein
VSGKLFLTSFTSDHSPARSRRKHTHRKSRETFHFRAVSITTARTGEKNRPAPSGRFWDDQNQPSPRPTEGGEGNQPARLAHDGVRQAVRLHLLRPMHRPPTHPPDGRPVPLRRSRLADSFPAQRPPVHACSDDLALPSTLSHPRSISPTACPKRVIFPSGFFFRRWSGPSLSFGFVPLL